jgi:tRNA A-37 threonylcarbamoyl transferase component Bud32
MSTGSLGPAVPDPSTVVGASQFGRYTLCVELASGGMASVYLAIARLSDVEKPVALKRIHPHLAKERQFVDMFLDEARIASLISHPHVCPVLDFGAHEQTYFLAMEFLVGESLARVLRAVREASDSPSVERWPSIAARLVADAAEGLHAAHELRDASGEPLDVVHRDVSPQNLFVTYDGGIRVVDFGIARAAGRIHQTATGDVKGKIAYMSPEHLRSERIDRRADVWALGVVLWELLTLTRLFSTKNGPESAVVSILEQPLVPPSSVRSGVPRALDAVVMRCLTRDRSARFATARELSTALDDAFREVGDHVGMGEIAELMTGLFPDGIARRRELVATAIARAREVGPPPDSVRPRSRLARWAPPAVAALVAAGVALPIGRMLAPDGPQRIAVIASSPDGLVDAPRGEPSDGPPTRMITSEGGRAITAPALELGVVDAAALGATTALDSGVSIGAEVAREEESALAPGEAGGGGEEITVATGPRGGRRGPLQRAAGTGAVNLVTPGGWAEVRERDRVLGETPLQVELAAGAHTLTLRFGDGATRTVRVDVRRGETVRVRQPAP